MPLNIVLVHRKHLPDKYGVRYPSVIWSTYGFDTRFHRLRITKDGKLHQCGIGHSSFSFLDWSGELKFNGGISNQLLNGEWVEFSAQFENGILQSITQVGLNGIV